MITRDKEESESVLTTHQFEEITLEDTSEKDSQSAWGGMNKDHVLDYLEERIRSYYQRHHRALKTDLQAYAQELNQLEANPHEAVYEKLAFLKVLYQFTLNKTVTADLIDGLKHSTESDEPIASSIKATLKIMELAHLSRQPEADMEAIAQCREEIKNLLAIMHENNGVLVLDEMDLSSILLESNNLLEGIDLSFTSFINANLRQARLSGCILREADLQQANLTDAILVHADLSLAKMQNTTCTNADFSAATAQLIMTDNTCFTHANFSHANLRGIHFEKCDISGARFDHAILTFSLFSLEQQTVFKGRSVFTFLRDIQELLKKEEHFLKKVLALIKTIDVFMYPHTGIDEDPHKQRVLDLERIDSAIQKILEQEGFFSRISSMAGKFKSQYPQLSCTDNKQNRIDKVKSKFYTKNEFVVIREICSLAIKAYKLVKASLENYVKTKEKNLLEQLQYDVIDFLTLLHKFKSLDPLERFNDVEGRIAMRIIENPSLILPPPVDDSDFFDFTRRPVEKSFDAKKQEKERAVIEERVARLSLLGCDRQKINAYWASLFPQVPATTPGTSPEQSNDFEVKIECRKGFNPMSGESV